jgi:hypothetical protein
MLDLRKDIDQLRQDRLCVDNSASAARRRTRDEIYCIAFPGHGLRRVPQPPGFGGDWWPDPDLEPGTPPGLSPPPPPPPTLRSICRTMSALAPVGIFGRGIEQAEIGDDVLLVVDRDPRVGRRQVIDIWIEWWGLHRGIFNADHDCWMTAARRNSGGIACVSGIYGKSSLFLGHLSPRRLRRCWLPDSERSAQCLVRVGQAKWSRPFHCLVLQPRLLQSLIPIIRRPAPRI